MVTPRERQGQPRRPRPAHASIVAALASMAAVPSSTQEAPAPGDLARGRAVAMAREWVLAASDQLPTGSWDEFVGSADDPVALELVRRVPRPLDPEQIPALVAELGRSRRHDQLVLERIATAPPGARDAALRDVAQQARHGRFGPELSCSIAHLRGATESVGGAADLFEDSLRPEPDVAAFSRQAFDRVVARQFARGRGREVAELLSTLAERHPELPNLKLEAAGASLAIHDLERADALYSTIVEAESGSRSTATLERRATARIGRAWVVALRGASTAADEALALAALWPRPRLAQEDALAVVELRAEFVAAVVRSIAGRPTKAILRRALGQAPLDVERCFVDEAWFGPLGPGALAPAFFVQEGADLRDARLRATLDLCDAIEATDGRHGHGLTAERGADEDVDRERLASWVFLGAADRILAERGDARAALAFLAPRVARLARSHLDANQELLAEAHLLSARCHLHTGDAAAARASIDAAGAVASALQTGASRAFVHRVATDEAPPPPMARLILRADPPYALLAARVRLARENLLVTLLGDARGAAEELFEAGAAWPFDEERWLQCALDFARRGRGDDARRCLACVEASRDHAYDRACVFAQLGEKATAIALLRDHLDGGAFTPGGRALELAFLARDRDLAPVQDDPGFPRE